MRGLVRRRNPFKGLFATTNREQYLERYVLREHQKGRPLIEIFEDPYVRAWSSPEQRARLLERPHIVTAIGEQTIADLQAGVAGHAVAGHRRQANRLRLG
jgi:hypothetical protein